MPEVNPAVLVLIASGDSLGLGILILGVGSLMAVGAAISLRTIWGRQAAQPDPLPRSGPLEETGKPLRSPAVGQMRTWFRILISFDFGCLALVSAVMLFLGLVVIFRALGR
ncbi:MAG TPA: hypothetical protein VMV23_07370 [Candidatus Nanopelagicaceae bacterium]|nr:hypothetical protein [Candidatus Nanopelagicaceae bacterium]